MPWPISAGVLGMARTTRSLPVARTIAALRMPAITLSCRAAPTKGAQGAAAAAKSCGLTAQTTRPQPASAAPAAACAATPNCCASWSRCAAKGSTTWIDDAARPAFNSPPMSALAMLPPPMKAMLDEFMHPV